jgi:hypothetical protein
MTAPFAAHCPEIFGRNKVLKDGTLGKEVVVPNLDAIQRHALLSHAP